MAKAGNSSRHGIGSDDAANSGTELRRTTSKLIVAAIDFGTTYSGYAYSMKNEYEKNHLKVFANPTWSDGDGLLTLKAPTAVLFDKQGTFHSFGFKAESTYAKLAEKEQHKGWQYFRRFKMKLYENKKITKTMLLYDDQGGSKPALEVISAAIEYLKDHLMKILNDRVANIAITDVFWVLTVPAIWNDGAKQFMEEAAKKGGLPDDQFTLALEPECAAIFCKESEIFKSTETNQSGHLQAFDPGSQFMIVDLGGGTVDITAHEVTNNSTLKELIVPSGGPWGGIVVDDAFSDMLTKMFTKDIIKDFNEECKSDALDLERTFETKKRDVNDQDETMVLKPPLALIEIYGEKMKQSFAETIKKGAFAQTVNKKRDKLICDTKLFIEMFRKPKEELIKHLKNILTNRSLRNLNTVLLVGGFAESEIMRDAIKTALNPKTVIWPNEAGLAVVKGAVIFGFNADSISSRKMPFTYGISAAIPYDDKKHPISKKVVRYGVAKCEDIFKVFIVKDTEVVPDKTVVEHTFNCPYIGAQVISVEIYKSSEKQPMFIDDKGSRKVGELDLQLQGKSSEPAQVIDVKMMFGKTQLEVQARQHGGLQGGVKAKFNFLA